MKKAAVIFLILAIIGSCIQFAGSITTLFLIKAQGILNSGNQTMIDILPLILIGETVTRFLSMAVTIVIASLSLWRLKVSKSRNGLIVWGVLSLIFCYLIPGILILCMKDKDLNEN